MYIKNLYIKAKNQESQPNWENFIMLFIYKCAVWALTIYVLLFLALIELKIHEFTTHTCLIYLQSMPSSANFTRWQCARRIKKINAVNIEQPIKACTYLHTHARNARIIRARVQGTAVKDHVNSVGCAHSIKSISFAQPHPKHNQTREKTKFD